MARASGGVWQAITKHHSAGIRESFAREALDHRPHVTVWLAWLFTTLVLLGYLALTLAGVWVLLHAIRPFHFWAFVLGVVALWLAGSSMPRRAGAPHVLTDTQAPELHALVQEISQAIGLKQVPRIAVSPDFNASYGTTGWRSQPVVTLGLPILYGFAPQERVAVIAHELAHGVNRDPARGWWMGLAQAFLLSLYWTLHPRRIWQAELGAAAFPAALGNLLLLALAGTPYGLLWVLGQLIGQDSQRAEYRADLLAAQVAGHEVTAQALDHLHLSHLYEYSLQKHRLRPERPDVFSEFAHQLGTYPPERLAHLREQLATEQLSLDASHPPTSWRVQVVSAHPRPALITLTEERAARLEAELRPFIPSVQRVALERHRERTGG